MWRFEAIFLFQRSIKYFDGLLNDYNTEINRFFINSNVNCGKTKDSWVFLNLLHPFEAISFPVVKI